MQIDVSPNKPELGRRAAEIGGDAIARAIAERGRARIILATGASQFDTLAALVNHAGVDWSVVEMFHLDEYVGMPPDHPASFRKYLRERFVNLLQDPLGAFHEIDATGDCAAECRRQGELIAREPVDVAFIGIGENGHLAFNDPPADFETDEPFLVVDLADSGRLQQANEGWFPSLAAVPRRAITMSIKQILKARTIVCSVPESRKAAAVRNAVEGPLTNLCPASILRTHDHCTLLLDADSASLLGKS